jgi:excisionase family DNA binding protein
MQELIVAVNQLKDLVKDLIAEIKLSSQSSNHQLTKEYLDAQTTCNILHVSDRTLYKMRNHGDLPFISVGRKILYKASDINAYIESKVRERKDRFRM